MSSPTLKLPIDQFFALLLASPERHDLLSELVARRQELAVYAMEHTEALSQDMKAAPDENWLRTVCDTINAYGLTTTSDEDVERARIKRQQSIMEEMIDIGYAVGQLTKGLPKRFFELKHWFQPKQRYPFFYRRKLAHRPDIVAAGELGPLFAYYGVTPLEVLQVARAPAGMQERLSRAQFPERFPLSMTATVEPVHVAVQQEVGRILNGHVSWLNCSLFRLRRVQPHCQPLLFWLVEVARLKPFAFMCLKATPTDTGVILAPDGTTETDLERWSR